MTEQDYKDKLAVRQQLSLADKFMLLEYEFNLLIKSAPPEKLAEMGIIRPAEEKKS